MTRRKTSTNEPPALANEGAHDPAEVLLVSSVGARDPSEVLLVSSVGVCDPAEVPVV